MTYADGRVLYDADSHLMESLDWLASYADGSTRERLGAMSLAAGGSGAARMIEAGHQRLSDPAATAALEDNVIGAAKGWLALGAMDPAEPTRALDLLGFQSQLVFTTFSTAQFAFSSDLDFVYGGTAAHNRGVTEFCADDPRLEAVGFVPLNDVTRALVALDEALAMGCRAIWVPHRAAGSISPAHIDLDPFWARVADAGVPFVLHVGGGRATLPRPFHDNGRPLPPDHFGGGENLRAKDYPSLHHSPETFLSCLVLDGVFERHPHLRCGVIELGAGWVPSFLRALDHAKTYLGRNEPLLSELTADPSDYVRRQVRFTPFPFEDVGWIIEQAGSELFMFSSDYPHPEGSRDPLGKFEASLDAAGISGDARTRFFSENYRSLTAAS